MLIRFNVDQTAALRLGIDAPTPTVVLDVNPTDLIECEREILAAVAVRRTDDDPALDATRLGLQTEPEGIVGQHHSVHHRELTAYSNGAPTGPLVLIGQTIDDLRASIAVMDAERAARHHAYVTACAAKRAAADDAIYRAISARDTQEIVVGLTRAGEATHDPVRAMAHWTIEVPCVPYASTDWASPEAVAELAAAVKEAEAVRQALIDDELPSLREELAAKIAADERAKVVREAEYADLYARLPAELRERDAAGYAGTDEVTKAIRRMLRAHAGYGDGAVTGYTSVSARQHLTDDEFRALRAIKADAPEGATVEPMTAKWVEQVACDYHADDDDGYDEDCADCGVAVLREQAVARVAWSRGGVSVHATRPLG